MSYRVWRRIFVHLNSSALNPALYAACGAVKHVAFTRGDRRSPSGTSLAVETDRRTSGESRLKAGCTVESPGQPVENTLGVMTGRLAIGRRLATCPAILRRAFIPFGGPKAHDDSQDWLPHKAVRRKSGRRTGLGEESSRKSGGTPCRPWYSG